MPKTGSSKGKEDPNVKYSFDYIQLSNQVALEDSLTKKKDYNGSRLCQVQEHHLDEQQEDELNFHFSYFFERTLYLKDHQTYEQWSEKGSKILYIHTSASK